MKTGPKPLSVLERFHRGLRAGGPEECWLWVGQRGAPTMGHVRIADEVGGRVYVHRLAYELAHGPIPSGLDVLHRCDVPRCCNPRHLFLGTFIANMTDKLRKNRQARGERNGMARLRAAQVREIRARAGTMLQRDLATAYGVQHHTISRILNRKRWAHLDPPRVGAGIGG